MKSIIFILFVASILFGGCSGSTSKQDPTQGNNREYFTYSDSVEAGGVRMIPIETPVGTFNVWTKRFGNNPRIKVLLLHGGPAMTHEYMECFETFFLRVGFEFYEYDQLGSYYSDQPTDSSNFFVLGNSWGGILAMEYALKYQQHLKGLIVANMVASAPEYGKYADEVLAKQMDPAVLTEIRAIEAKQDFSNPRFMELLQEHYYNHHICRLNPWPEPCTRSFKHGNNAIYTLM